MNEIDYKEKSELDCVNYYLDHGVDFIIEYDVKDKVGNNRVKQVYVDVVDTTPPGFTKDADNLIKSSNIGTDCRMEIGQTIGFSNPQAKADLLKCYNINVGLYTFIALKIDKSKIYKKEKRFFRCI